VAGNRFELNIRDGDNLTRLRRALVSGNYTST
jgi:hypothetical protein